MILWTIQDIAVLKALEKGPYTTQNQHIIFPEWEDDDFNHCNYAYQWLTQQMTQRIGPAPKNVKYPIWAWYKRQGHHDGKPDMRSWKAEPNSHHVVRMKLDVPDWQVLLTDFDDWHCALNYWHLPQTKEDADNFDAMLEKEGINWIDLANWEKTSPQLTKFREMVEQSWQNMIGIQPDLDDYCSMPWINRTIQATFWELKPDYVLSTETFKAQH